MLRRITASLFVLALVASSMMALVGTGSVDAEPMDKVFVCHHTGAETNEYVLVEVNGNALEGHDGPHHQHGLDIVLWDGSTSCPTDDDDPDLD